MFFPKACPRCIRGDVHSGEDAYGMFLKCMQCGWHLDVGEIKSHGPDIMREPATTAPRIAGSTYQPAGVRPQRMRGDPRLPTGEKETKIPSDYDKRKRGPTLPASGRDSYTRPTERL